LILASASPRRAELLAAAGFTFEVRPVDVDETPLDGERPTDYVGRLAKAKAAAAVVRAEPGAVVLAADTTVVAKGRILGKPAGAADASDMLRQLSGDIHLVHTAVTVRVSDRERSEVVTSRVRFVPLTEDDIAWYVATGEPEGKAGAYAIQGRAARFVDWIEGSWSNIVGLPVADVHRLLKDIGV
jgi:septum formation protein